MPGNLVDFSIQAPGFLGLNKQNSGDILPLGWATEAKNLVFDDVGRLASRKGTFRVNSTAISGSPDVKTIHEYIDNGGNITTILSAGNKIYSSSGATLTDITGALTITADNWKFVNFNSKVVAFQLDHDPIIWTGAGSFTRLIEEHTDWAPSTAYVVGNLRIPTTATDYYLYCSTSGTSAVTEPTWLTSEGANTSDGTAVWTTHKIPSGNEAIAAGGRLWIINGTVLNYSDTLIPHYFDTTNFINQFDLKTVWRNGMDVGVGLAEFNGHLCILGKKTITVYQGYDDVSTMSLVENIAGIGCIGRDTIQDIGTDILFLSPSGVRSLGRTIQEKSMPVNDISRTVRQYLLDIAFSETSTNIKSTYSEKEGFYLLSFPTDGTTFCFDIRQQMEGGVYKITEWDTSNTSFMSSLSGDVYIGTAGYLNKYSGYLDSKNADATGGTSYDFLFESGWTNFDPEISSLLKIPKKASMTVYGGNGQSFLFKWAFDYSNTFNSVSILIPIGDVAEYGIAEYGISEYSGGIGFNSLKRSINRKGRVMKVGASSTVEGRTIALQRISVQSKLGKMVL